MQTLSTISTDRPITTETRTPTMCYSTIMNNGSIVNSRLAENNRPNIHQSTNKQLARNKTNQRYIGRTEKTLPNGRRTLYKTARQERRSARIAEYAKAQQLWKKSKANLMGKILNSTSLQEPPNQLPLDSQYPYWKDLFETKSIPFTGPTFSDNDTSTPPITIEEVATSLKSLNDGAPGPDHIRKSDHVSIGIHRLAMRFNLYILTGICPSAFKVGTTTLIPKCKLSTSPNQYRPITLASMVSRLFHRLLASRISRVIKLGPRQKAFAKRDGICENLYLLNSIIKKHKQECKSLKLCFLDVSKAFDSVSHHAISALARRVNTPTKILKYINNLYNNNIINIKIDQKKSNPIRICRGVKQGDPLSPILFNSVMDYCVDCLVEEDAINIGLANVSHLAFADDIVVFSDTTEGLQRQVNLLSARFKQCGLSVNPSKCKTLNIVVNQKRGVWACESRPFLNIGLENIGALQVLDTYKYLGIETGILKPNNGPIYCNFNNNLAKLDRAPLKPHQKVELCRDYLIPASMHMLNFSGPTKRGLQSLDKATRRYVRRWLRLPKDTSLGVFHASTDSGGLAIPVLALTIPVIRSQRMAKILGGDDPLVEILGSRDRLGWSVPPSKDGVPLRSTSEVRASLNEQLVQSVDGRVLVPGNKLNGWIRCNRLINAHDYINVFKLRHNILPCPARARRAYPEINTQCAFCGYPNTTMTHILQRCPQTHVARVRRHDKVTAMLASSLENKRYMCFLEPHIRTPTGILKPDLITCRDGLAVVVDTQITTDPSVMDERFDQKTHKYDIPLVREFVINITGASEVKFGALILDWRGQLATRSDALLNSLGMSASVKELITIRTLEGGVRAYRHYMRAT